MKLMIAAIAVLMAMMGLAQAQINFIDRNPAIEGYYRGVEQDQRMRAGELQLERQRLELRALREERILREFREEGRRLEAQDAARRKARTKKPAP